jgi:hypothetical protein
MEMEIATVETDLFEHRQVQPHSSMTAVLAKILRNG